MIYGLIGEKLAHSFSAEIHPRLWGYAYELKELAPSELESFLEKREFSGINVTIPYKQAVIPYLDELDESAQMVGAVNTIVHREGRLLGYNTDYFGLRDLVLRTGLSLRDKTVLILGSGGTSKTAVAVAKSLDCRRAIRVSRTEKEDCISYSTAKETFQNADILINTTPCGMFPNLGECAVDIADFPCLEGVVDVVYNPLRTKLVCDAQNRGIPAVGGLFMLVAQAAYAGEIFTGKSLQKDVIESVYQQLLRDKENIVLIGMPGCGKTTVGKRLSERLNLEFLDTDLEIVQQENRNIPEIFALEGEAYFRRMESAVIHAVSQRQHSVIATGGGVVLNAENSALLRENGRVYFLDRPLSSLAITKDRPLASDENALKERYNERCELYCAACDYRVANTDTIEAVVDQIREDWMKCRTN